MLAVAEFRDKLHDSGRAGGWDRTFVGRGFKYGSESPSCDPAPSDTRMSGKEVSLAIAATAKQDLKSGQQGSRRVGGGVGVSTLGWCS